MAGMVTPSSPLKPVDWQQAPHLGDWVILDGNLTATEAYTLASCLTAAGIDARPADTRIAQIWANAIGGAKVRVPQAQLAQAQQILEAFRRGEFALGDDFDVGDERP